jgi:hypothetical protein
MRIQSLQCTFLFLQMTAWSLIASSSRSVSLLDRDPLPTCCLFIKAPFSDPALQCFSTDDCNGSRFESKFDFDIGCDPPGMTVCLSANACPCFLALSIFLHNARLDARTNVLLYTLSQCLCKRVCMLINT